MPIRWGQLRRREHPVASAHRREPLHYLPAGSTQHLDGLWYAGNGDTLSPLEIEWINTAALLKNARAEGFSNKAHRSIWGKPLKIINEYGPNYSDDYRRVADDIAFYNFFLRPGLEGDSLLVSAQDVEFANAAFRAHYQRLKPTAVVFLSSLAHYHFHEPVSIPVAATPHPGCRWWNRVAQKYGNKRGRDILADFITTLKWPQCPDSK